MTDQQHPITPPPELVQQWMDENPGRYAGSIVGRIAAQAARWGYQQGADTELKACCEYLSHKVTTFSADAHFEAQRRSDDLRAARRPKPPSLKEQALAALAAADGADYPVVATIITADQHDIIRRALEQLDD